MNNASLELGGTNWAEKDGNILGYSVGDTSGKYSPQEFTFARGSNLSATRIDRAGLIVKGRENLLLQSNSFSTTWLNSNTSVTSGQLGYDGTNNAWLLTKTADNFSNIRQNITFSGVHTFSVYLKQGTNTSAILRTTGGTTAKVEINLIDGTTSGLTSVVSAKTESIGGNWWRCSLTLNASSDTAVRSLRKHPKIKLHNRSC